MKDKLLLIWKHLKPENLQKMWLQSKWIWQYGKRYWKSMVVYTLLGIAGSGVSLVSSFISKDLIDIITGHQTGKLLSTFAAMIGFSIANILFSQASTYASTFINLKVDSEIKNDIFAKMLVTDWESLTDYHTGDLVTRWSSDASNISSGILNWIPNLVIYIFRFISALAVVLYYDPTFALFALIGIPFSAILSKPLLRRMSNNNAKSAAMNAKMYGFNQETFSNIQTIFSNDSGIRPVRSLTNFGGYVEGWATYVEMQSFSYGCSDTIIAEIYRLNRSLNLGISSFLDILIHYYGYDRSQTAKVLSQFGLNGEGTADAFFNTILEAPANYLKYYVGYLCFEDLKQAALKKEGASFSLKNFHKKILETGPCLFPVLYKYVLQKS